MKRLVIGIDPATNSVGFVAFDPDTRKVHHVMLIEADKKQASYDRIRFIAEEVGLALEGIDPEIECFVYSENTVMRGAGGATFQRGIGAIHAAVPERMHISEIQNSTVKKMVGGHGKAEKDEVAGGAIEWLGGNQLAEYARSQMWDVTDAAAIGIAGWLRDHGT